MYTNQTEELIHKIREAGAKRVMLQLPMGLRIKSAEIAEALSRNGIDAVLALNPCYGACDLADEEAKQSECELLVHVGHSKFYRDFKTAVPVVYFPWTTEVNLKDIDFSVIKEKRIGLLTTIQHLPILTDVKDMLEKDGKRAEIGGQVLGCWFANAEKIADKVDAFLYVGSGRFHPLGVRGKIVYTLDIERQQIEKIDTTALEKRRWANIYNAKDAKVFAVLTTTKKGQNQLLDDAEKIKKIVEGNGRMAFVVTLNEINDANLLGIRADAFVNTACPRIVEDHFSKPIINAEDVEKVFTE